MGGNRAEASSALVSQSAVAGTVNRELIDINSAGNERIFVTDCNVQTNSGYSGLNVRPRVKVGHKCNFAMPSAASNSAATEAQHRHSAYTYAEQILRVCLSNEWHGAWRGSMNGTYKLLLSLCTRIYTCCTRTQFIPVARRCCSTSIHGHVYFRLSIKMA